MSQRQDLRIGRWIPGWTLRAALAVLPAVAGLLLTDALWLIVVTALIGALGACAPRTHAGALVTPALMLMLLSADAAPWRTAVALLTGHAALVLFSLSLRTAASERIALRALGPTARRWLLVQAIAQLAGVAFALVQAALVGAATPWLAVAAAAGAVALTCILVMPLVDRD